MLARTRSVLPHGPVDLLRQIVLFCGAYWLYRLVRGLVDGRAAEAFDNARAVIDIEQALGLFIEPSVHAWASSAAVINDAASWLYLNSHFAVTTVVLAWIYLRRNERFYFVRNMFLVAMGLALVGYALLPTAPPRRAGSSRGCAPRCGPGTLVSRPLRSSLPGVSTPTGERPRSAREYQTLVRNRLIESRLTPNAISLTGLVLCLGAAVLVWQELFFLGGIAFVIGSVCDTLDGRYSRMSGKGTPFGAFLDSTLDRIEEGVVLTAVAAYFSSEGDDLAVAAVVVAVLASLMVSYTRD